MKTRLRVLRAEKEWSQADLADAVGVTRQCINAVETGKYEPGLDLAFKIARTFGKNVEEVFLYEESETPIEVLRIRKATMATILQRTLSIRLFPLITPSVLR